jgi:hypothetical protein
MSGNGQDEQEGFLTRWSRRKALSRQGEDLPEPDADTDGEDPQAAPPAREPPPAPEEVASERAAEVGAATSAEEVELPPLESLGEDSDYSAFLRDGVPAGTKQKALRKLFHSPKFNIRDGLDDYDWDLSKPEPLGDVITAEMRYRVERELERLAGLDDDDGRKDETIAVADTAEHEEPDNEADPEADDDRPEPA